MKADGFDRLARPPAARRFARRRVLIAGATGIAAVTLARSRGSQATDRGDATPSATQDVEGTVLFADDFLGGFSTDGPTANWVYFAVPGPDGAPVFVGDDGAETTSPEGLRVAAAGTNPQTGEPAFTKSVPQEDDDPLGLPGGFDHVKWLVYTNRLAASGLPGHDATPGRELSGGARLAGRTFGTAGHPFGVAVADPDDDLRLAGVALNAFDLESWMVFDFFLTNRRVYAIYERLPFGRPQLGDYAAFTHLIPLTERGPDDVHDLLIGYDRGAGVVRWLVGDEEAFRVERIGRRLDRRYLIIDHGGSEEDVAPRQLNFGMGMFTLLDAALPAGSALVRLSIAPDFYFDPSLGTPAPQAFVDEASQAGSRLFGQGAELRVRDFVVEDRPAPVAEDTGTPAT